MRTGKSRILFVVYSYDSLKNNKVPTHHECAALPVSHSGIFSCG